jgi:transporter family-2 protein
MHFMLIWLAIVAGCASALQGATNGALSGRLGLSNAVLINAFVVTLGASALWIVLPRGPSISAAAIPWFLFLGGLYGLVIIAGAAFAFPRLGAGPTTALMVAAQLCAALILDHLGLPSGKIAVTPIRVVGACFLIAGALLVLWPKLASART